MRCSGRATPSSAPTPDFVATIIQTRETQTKMDEDYYKILGIQRNASPKEIQQAYRKLARKFHPDLNPEDKTAKAKFQRVQQAYDVLNEPEKRELYDRYGNSFEAMQGGGPGRARQGASGFNEVDFNEIFGQRGEAAGFEGNFADLFQHFAAASGRGPTKKKARGSDIQHELTVPFQTALVGGDAEIAFVGASGNTETIAVKIPAGIDDGKKIRVRGHGQPGGRGGNPGDLIITIRVAPHPHFRRKGNHLEVDVPVTIAEAALGAKIDVPTPQGTITLTVPRGSSSGRRLRIKGHGVPKQDEPGKGQPGDLFAVLQIVMPGTIDDETAELIQKLAARQSFHPRADLRW